MKKNHWREDDIEYTGISKELVNVQKDYMQNEIGTEDIPTPPLSPLPDKVNPKQQSF